MTSIKNLLTRLAIATTLIGASSGACAALYQLDFTGVITNSTDFRGVLFGNGPSGGQNGLTISGRLSFDSTAYPDQNASPFFGAYGPTNGLFPQPSNAIVSNYSIAGQTFFGSQYMGPSSQHSIEAGSTQNIPPVNFIQQDIYRINDGSQKLLCADANNPLSCTGGALATNDISLSLFGIFDFLGSDALAQPLDLDQSDINAIVGAPGGGQNNQYLMTFYSDVTTLVYSAAGEFSLTSLRLAERQTPTGNTVPEPGTLALCLLAAAGLVKRRRA